MQPSSSPKGMKFLFVLVLVLQHFVLSNGQSSACRGQTLEIQATATEGSIYSPNYPFSYPRNSYCEWHIKGPDDSILEISIDHYVIEAHRRCRFDSLKIYAGSDSNSPRIARLCGRDSYSFMDESVNEMFIVFSSDRRIHYSGFLMTFQSITFNRQAQICRRTPLELEAESSPKLIESPGYPISYPDNSVCRWSIIPPENSDVFIQVTDFFTERNYDGLDIGNESVTLIARLSGTESDISGDGTFLISGTVSLLFASDDYVTERGFQLTYQAVARPVPQDDPCAEGGRLTLPATFSPQTIQSPLYPAEYPNKANCNWVITSPDDDYVQITVDFLQLQNNPSCELDALLIYDGSRSSDTPLANLCGSISLYASRYWSTSNVMLISFRSDDSVPDNGFTLTYQRTQNSYQECQGQPLEVQATTVSQSIQSPDYPEDYFNNALCGWIIKSPSFVFMQVEDVKLENTSNCANDALEIFDGADQHAEITARLCGQGVSGSSTFRSSSDQVYIRFRSDESITDTGFRLHYQSEHSSDLACQSEPRPVSSTLSSQTIESVNYPGSAPRNSICHWLIKSSSDFVITEIEDFRPILGADCETTGLDIFDGSDTSAPSLVNLCDEDAVVTQFTSTSGEVLIRYRTPGFNINNGFRLTHRSLHASYQACNNGPQILQASYRQENIKSPDYPRIYPSNSSCTWRVEALEDVIRIHVLYLSIPDSPSCTEASLEIYDGSSQQAPILRRYCGQDSFLSEIFFSSSQMIFIRFQSSTSSNGGGFLLTYNGVNESFAACQGIPLTLTASATPQTIYSPNSPMYYPNNADCRWFISSPTSSLRISVEYFALEDHSECMYDRLDIFEGGNSDSPHLAKLCGVYENKLMYTSSSDLTLIHFHSDWSETAMGFQIIFHSVRDIHPACMGSPLELQANSDFEELTSPGFPEFYPSQLLCSWVIESSLDFVHIHVQRIYIQDTPDCSTDGLQIFDGDSQYSSLMTELCGFHPSAAFTYRSSSKKLFIRFYSDVSISGEGFQLLYRSETEFNPACNGSIELEATPSPQILDSPRFPMDYPNDVICEWKMMSSAFIRIHILEMWIPGNTDCTNDALEIFDGENDRSPHLVKLCGEGIINIVGYKSSSNVILIRFHASGTSTDKGFRLSYRREDDSLNACSDGPLTLQATPVNQSIQFPEYASHYPNNENCDWTVESPSGILRISIEYLWLEYHSRCDYDVLEIYQGASMSFPLVARLCGNVSSTLYDYWISSDVTYIRFHSDNSVTYAGFRLTYQSVEDDYACQAGPLDVQASMYPQSIYSPGYPQAYPNNVLCAWRIKSSLDFIHLNFEDLNVVESSSCSNDVLEIFDGSTQYSPNVTRLCFQDSADQRKFISSSNVVLIHFHSDESLTDRGFRLTYMSVDDAYEACNDGPLYLQANLDLQYIQSPGFPKAYPSNSSCSWRITSFEGIVLISFTEFKLYNHSSCMNDRVVIFDGPDETSPILGEFCGQNQPTGEYSSSSNGLYIRFYSDYSFTSVGFEMTYRAPACSDDVVSLHASEELQVLESKGFPRVYQDGTYCTWLIESPLSYILIEIQELDMTGNFNCEENSLEIIDGEDDISAMITFFCGEDNFNSRIVLTPSNMSLVHFRSNGSSRNRGFRFTYQAVDEPHIVCSSPLELQATDRIKTIDSPGYPESYPSTCDWLIQSPQNDIRLFAERYFLPQDYDCANNSLEIFDGPNASFPRLASICGEEQTDWIYTSGTVAYILFQSVENISIFELRYQNANADFEACRTNVVELKATSSPETLVSPHYPSNYPRYSKCRWQIESSESYLRFEIEDIEIEESAGCLEDALKIFDGGNDSASPLARFCDMTKPDVTIYWTESNLAFITFFTSWTFEHRGFRLTYQSTEQNAAACRGDVVHLQAENFTQILISVGYPVFYPNFTECSWVLESSSDIVHIVIEDLRIQPGFRDNCFQDVLEIFDGEDEFAPLIDSVCGTRSNLSYWSGHKFMFIVFRTDREISAQGFRLTYNAEDRTHQACVGDLLDLHATHMSENIYSPGYPNSYPSNADCAWHIGTSSGIVHLYIESLNILSSENCASDGLEIFDGGNENAPLLIRLCGEFENYTRDFNSSTNEVLVRFYSDGSGSSTGFLMHYYSQPSADECTDTPVILRASSLELTFTTPGFNENGYGNNIDCGWVFWAPGAYIHLYIQEVHIEYDELCRWDVFEIFDGADRSAKRLAELCGDSTYDFYWSTSSRMYVHLRTDDTVTAQGVRLTYQRVEKPEACPLLPVLLTAEKYSYELPDIVESSFFPTPFPSESVCEWHISSSEDYVFLNVTNLLIDESLNCSENSLEIFDVGNGTEVLLARFCGGEILPKLMISTTDFVVLRFRTGGSPENLGFRLEYKTVRHTHWSCFGIDQVVYASSSPQILTSPDYPERYDNDTHCQWLIKSPGAFVRISIDLLDVQFLDDPYNNLTDCAFESLTVYDGPYIRSPVMGIHCFPVIDPIIYWSSADTLRIAFRSDALTSYTGFSLTYQRVEDSHQACQVGPFEIVAADFYQTIFPPRYPDGYPSDCTWRLVSSIDFIAFYVAGKISHSPSCETNVLEIFDGSTGTSQSLARLCGEVSTREIVSNSNEVFIHFRSEGPVSDNDFNVTYKSVEKAYHACEDGPLELDAPDYYFYESQIFSPTYPGGYPANCTWRLTSSKSFLRFRAFGVRVYGNSDCIDDNLFIYDGPDENAPLLVNLCGEEITHWFFTSLSNVIFIRFESEGPVNRSEFALAFENADETFEGCQGTVMNLTATTVPQILTSPNYPSDYPIDLTCRWHITAPPGNYIEIAFSDIYIQPEEFNGACIMDALEIYDGPDETFPVIDEICWINPLLLNSYWTTSNEAYLYLYSDVFFRYRGFNLTYISTEQNYPECRGSVSQLQATSSPQTIMSPRYPDLYPNNTRCSWQIETISGLIYIDVKDLKLQLHPLDVCDADAVEIYDGQDVSGILLARLCGNKTSRSYWSTSKFIFIHFRSDSMFADSGFMLTYQTVQPVHQACNDHFYDAQASFSRQIIQSPEDPSPNPNNTDCAWRMRAPSGLLLILIEDLQIIESQNCTNDALVIYDGLNENATQLAKLCGQDSSNTSFYLTTSPAAFIHFYTSESGSSFQISHRQIGNDYEPCQGTPTVLQATSFVLSLNWFGLPMPLNRDTVCKWHINSSYGFLHIIVQSVSMNSDANCPTDSLEIYDGNETSALLAKVCDTSVGGFQLQTSGNMAFIQMNLGMSESFKSIEVTFFIAQSYQECQDGTDLIHSQPSTQAIESPGYPAAYPRNSICEWRVESVNGSLHLSLTDLMISESDNCVDDALEIYDGIDDSAAMLAQVCSEEGIQDREYTSTTNVVFIRFRSDDQDSSRGFIIYHSSEVGNPRDCPSYPVVLQAEYSPRRLLSPGYPEYDNDMRCQWRIWTPNDLVRISIDYYLFEFDSSCQLDFLEIFDGPNSDAPSLARLCYAFAPGPYVYVSSSSAIFLHFESDFFLTFTGFNLTYEARVCADSPTTLESSYNNTVLQSPGFPRFYPSNTKCTWLIQSSEDFILIEVQTLNAELDCLDNGLEIFDGDSDDIALMKRPCGEDPESYLFLSSFNTVFLRFHSDGSAHNDGFSLKYQSLSACAGGRQILQATDSVKTITSPGFPNAYPLSINCEWLIESSVQPLQLTLTNLKVENHSICANDALEIYEGADQFANHLARECGGISSPVVFLSNSNVTFIRFFSNNQISDEGFSLDFQYNIV